MGKIVVKDKSGFSEARWETVVLSASDCRKDDWEMLGFERHFESRIDKIQ